MADDANAIGIRIRILRNAKALSLERLADLAGLARNTLWRIETGATSPQHESVRKIADVLGIEPEDLTNTDDAALPNNNIFRSNDSDGLALALHWSDMLRAFTQTFSIVGPLGIHQIIRGELTLIHQRRRQATGPSHSAFLVVEAQWAEFASWISFNLGKHDEARRWLERSLFLARKAEHKPLISYALMRFAQHAADYGDADLATAFSREAVSTPTITSRDVALCKIREAHGLALMGDEKGSRKLFDSALDLVQRADATSVNDDPRTLGQHCTPAYVLAHLGFCQLLLGDNTRAIDAISDALCSGFSDSFHYDEGLARVWLATAYADAGEMDDAASEGMHALTIACKLGSARIISSLRKVDTRFGSFRRPTAQMIQFRAAYAATQGRRR